MGAANHGRPPACPEERSARGETLVAGSLAAVAEKLALRALSLEERAEERVIIGITGAPGAGKSTLAGAIASRINADVGEARAVVVGMDGYHLTNEELSEKGLLELKGIPSSFDAAGFVELVDRLRRSTTTSVRFPIFDRSIEASIPEAGSVEPQHTIVFVEGNYLLNADSPWHQLRCCIDRFWYIDVEESVLIPRLIERHLEGGRSLEGAREKMDSTDLPNARLIAATRHLSDLVVGFDDRQKGS